MGGELTEALNPNVIYAEFGPDRTRPLDGSVSLDDFLAELESDPDTAALLVQERRDSVDRLGIDAQSLRGLRLRAGISQATLAARAETTQSHIASIEAATTDPRTAMVVRIAVALQIPVGDVFSAIVRDRRT